MCVKYATQTTQKRQFLNLFCASLLPHLYMVSSCVYPHDAGKRGRGYAFGRKPYGGTAGIPLS